MHEDVETEVAQQRCSHCFITQTPQWRRHTHGILLCNSCGLKARRMEVRRRRAATRSGGAQKSQLLRQASSLRQQSESDLEL